MQRQVPVNNKMEKTRYVNEDFFIKNRMSRARFCETVPRRVGEGKYVVTRHREIFAE